jgi:hypothetical protein
MWGVGVNVSSEGWSRSHYDGNEVLMANESIELQRC